MAVLAAIAVAPRAAHATCQNILVGASQANNGNSAVNLATNPAKDADNALWIGKGAKNPTATIVATTTGDCGYNDSTRYPTSSTYYPGSALFTKSTGGRPALIALHGIWTRDSSIGAGTKLAVVTALVHNGSSDNTCSLTTADGQSVDAYKYSVSTTSTDTCP